jgi:5-methylcytosine-specific restriction endonuclease McrA
MNKQCRKCKETKSLDSFCRKETGKYGVNSICKDCFKEYSKEYYTNNKDRLNSKHRKYYADNREWLLEHNRKYYKTDRGKQIMKLKSQNRRYRKQYNTNPEEKLTKKQLDHLTEVYTHCAYCSTPLTSENTHIDHIHPLSKGGSHSIDNVVLACKDCNLKKHTKTLDEWLNETGYSVSIKHLVFMRLQSIGE